jgi:hypothetical protein
MKANLINNFTTPDNFMANEFCMRFQVLTVASTNAFWDVAPYNL